MNKAEIKEKLRAFICTELLGRPDFPLADDEALITGGFIDSFSLVQIGVFIEKAFETYILDTDLTVENMDTLEKMATRIMQEKRP